MRPRNTVIALVVLLVVGGLAYYVAHQPSEKTVKLYQVKPEDISKIELRYPGREIELERGTGGRWTITKPVKVEAAKTTADNLARAIAECEVKKTVEEKPADLAPFGLAKPAVVVTVTTKAKGTLPGIEVGKTTPVGFSAYIKTTDKPAVLLTSSAFPPGMTKTLSDLRDRELMAFKVDDIRKIDLEREGLPTVELDKHGDQWSIVKPARYLADLTQVRQLLSALANARVADFISDYPPSVTQYGLERPRLTVAVSTGKAEQSQSLLFGGKQTEAGKDGIYVRRGERTGVYTVHQYVMDEADKSVFDLRDKTVLVFNPAAVQSVTVTAAKSFSLSRAGGKWQLAGVKGDADVAVVERFLNQLHDLKGQRIVEDPLSDPSKFGMDRPAEKVLLAGKDGKALGAISLAKVERRNEPGHASAAPPEPPQRADYYAASSAGTALYSIDDFTFGQLTKTAEQFRAAPAPTTAPSPGPAK